jgi:hypothetical protein
LTSGELAIGRNLTFIGPGANLLTVSGNHASRVFNISSGITVSISYLTIRDGTSVDRPSVGSGIYNSGTLTVNNCTLTGNIAFDSGGGIYNTGALTANNCTLSTNVTHGDGGGIFNSFNSGINSGSVTLNNCTLFFNGATIGGGGGICNGGSVTLNNCTLSGNLAEYGGGISTLGSSLTMLNTIVADNGSGLPSPDVLGSVSSQGHNLISKTDGSSGWVVTDLTGTIAVPRLALLGPLRYNGGPTSTMLPHDASPAIDAGDDSVLSFLATDQRGRPRESGAHVDIGAVEVGPIRLYAVSHLDSGPGSLRQHILDASPGEHDIIILDPSLTGVITLSSGELMVDKSLSIIGPGANLLTVSGIRSNRVFHVTNGPVVIANLTIAEGHTSGGGGGIAVDSGASLTVSNCTITGCYAAGTDAFGTGGGAISAVGSASLAVIGSTLSSNSTPADGGGIYLFNGPTVSVINSTISGNRTLNGSGDGWGGGIFQINGGTLTVTACTIANNTSVSQGGGLYKGLGGSATITSSLIAGNSAPGGRDCQGTFVSGGYNLIGNSSGSSGLGQVGDQLNVDPKIGPLADNGGPTFTHALLAGSPAIDQGKSFGLATDQRGQLRPFDFSSVPNATNSDGSDIGAFEAQAVAIPPRITSVLRSGNDLQLSFTSQAGHTYNLLSALDLVTATWSPLLTGIPGTGGNVQVIIPNTFDQPKQFFRIQQTP